jgi:hypothetical protein
MNLQLQRFGELARFRIIGEQPICLHLPASAMASASPASRFFDLTQPMDRFLATLASSRI